MVVGRLVTRHEENMRTIFEVNDNTDIFKIIFYQKGENEVPTALKDFNYKENMYVRIIGSIRIFKEEKAIVGNKIQEIVKHGEVTNHFLKVFTAHAIRKHGLLTESERLNGQGQAAPMGQIKKAPVNCPNLILETMKSLKNQYQQTFINKTDIWNNCQRRMDYDEF